MGDIYDTTKAQKQKQKKQEEKNLQEDDNSIVEEARRIKDENYEQAKDIRQQLGQAAIDQKQASEEFKRQGEVLENAKTSAVNIHKEAKKGEELADEIEREGSIFTCRFACIETICKWFKKDNGSKEVEEIKNKKYEVEENEEIQNEEYKEIDELVPGQNKTDKELVNILNTVRGIKQEAESQSKEAKKQKSVIKDINKVTEESEKVIKKTDEHLKRIE
ncbi:uncharacterized protein VNE69_12155 [Vairimorpha necatrix]|uniref:Uncharacterized protein n=1 Tax=Vairimorpha necatrix TaxID=6039 RepID=A0AAX4JGK4_9MICR